MDLEEFLNAVAVGSEGQVQSGARLDASLLLDLIQASKFPCGEVLWSYLGQGLEIEEIAGAYDVTYDAARMKIRRCLEAAQAVIKTLK